MLDQEEKELMKNVMHMEGLRMEFLKALTSGLPFATAKAIDFNRSRVRLMLSAFENPTSVAQRPPN